MRNVIIVCLFLSALSYGAESIKSTASDRIGVEVTVYNNNLGLIKERRKVKLQSGQGEMQFSDVASQINPVTVHAQSTGSPEDFTVLEQNYEYDLISHEKLMEKYIGKKIKLIDWNQYQDRKETIEATLVSVNGGEVYKIGNQIYLGHSGTRVLPELPEDLIAIPTLKWTYSSKSSKENTLEVSYLTEGISWNADYVLLTKKGDRSGDLSSWVTVNNQCGAAFKDAELKLVAGKVNRAMPQVRLMGMRKNADMAMSEQPFNEEAFSEYHLYDLQRKTTIKNNQTKQISLFESPGLSLKKEYLVYGQQGYLTGRYYSENFKQPVQVFLSFTNSKDNGLGIPLPAGTVRIYSADSHGKQQFAGEDQIDHTPRDEDVRLKSGEAFDIVAEQKQTSFKQLSSQLYESEWSVVIRNRKDEDITVGVIQKMNGNWEIVNSNQILKRSMHSQSDSNCRYQRGSLQS